MLRNKNKHQVEQLIKKLYDTYNHNQFIIDYKVIRGFGDDFKNLSETRINSLISKLSGAGFLISTKRYFNGKMRSFYQVVGRLQ